jgi:hypothetical protein
MVISGRTFAKTVGGAYAPVAGRPLVSAPPNATVAPSSMPWLM